MEEDLALPQGFSSALQLSLNSLSSTINVAEHDSAANCSSPLGCRIAHEFLFSRSLLPTYYLVLLTVVIFASCLHWSNAFSRWNSSKRVGAKLRRKASSPASSTSTLVGSASPSIKDDGSLQQNEDTPLLAAKALSDQSKYNFLKSTKRRIEAWLCYQPEPIPAITSPSNHLPPNGTALVVLLLLAVNAFYLFYHSTLSGPLVFAFADRAGICFVTNLPILHILGAKSNQPLKFLTGWSYEGLNIFHRRLGEWMMILAIVHGMGMYGFWYILLRPFHFTLGQFLSNHVILLGNLALISYLAIYITSIGWFRRLYYETFLGLHIILQVGALAFLYFHHPRSRTYVVVSIFIWSLDRIIVRNTISLNKFVATLEIAEDGETVLLFCDIPISKPFLGVRRSIRNGWQAGHHVFVTISGLGNTHRLQTHPFTIASPAPPASLQEGTWPLQLTIRAQDGFSKDLLAYAKFHQHTEVWLDGPYGANLLEELNGVDRTCLIAGGSGIAVTYPMMWALSSKDLGSPIVNRTTYQNGVRMKPRISEWQSLPTSKDSLHMWVRQDQRHDSWLKIVPGQPFSRPNTNESVEGVTAIDLVNARFETRSSTGSRPDLQLEMRDWVEQGLSTSPDIKALQTVNKRDRIAVIVSGPDGLVRDVRNGVATLIREGWNIEIHVEKFGW